MSEKPKRKKNKFRFRPAYGLEVYLLWGVCALLLLPVYLMDRQLFVTLSICVLFVVVITLFLLLYTRHRMQQVMTRVAKSIDPRNSGMLQRFPVPTLVADGGNVVVWCNDRFRAQVAKGSELVGKPLKKILPELIFASDSLGFEGEISYLGKSYTVYASAITEREETYYSYYFFDQTKYKNLEKTHRDTRPCVTIITVDNLDELLENEKDSERMKISLAVERALDGFLSETNGIMLRVRRDRYVAVIEEQHLKKIIENKFAVLENMRTLVADYNVPITLSIGIGRGADTMQSSEQMARQALDMAIGRGGDQAVIKTNAGYDFYGGVSQAMERHTKGKTRIVAAALLEFLEVSSNVLIMGHKNADLDSFGSAVGLGVAIAKLGKRVNIVMDTEVNLAQPLLNRLMEEEEYREMVVEEDAGLELLEKKTLLIIVDTHGKNLLESEEIYRQAGNIVVIDHHRKLVGYIDNAVLFYHEPYASSTSEMITELTQYFGDKYTMGRFEAEALLSGIMLDTKNFVIKTGVRTFEAAAYLRRRGADTVEVRRFFSSSMSAYQTKAVLVASAQIYKKCAIAVAEGTGDELKIIVPQAADELLTISGVDASFVIYEAEGKVNISARSMGVINVQIIMENLGGGGHHTMAGTQIERENAGSIKQKLQQQIDEYYSRLT